MSATDSGSDSSDAPVALAVVALLAMAVLGVLVTAFAFFLGFGTIGVLVPVLGAVVALPLVALVGYLLWDRANADGTESADGDPVAELRERYARGEIDEAEFERRLDGLLETEDLEGRGDDSERSVELE